MFAKYRVHSIIVFNEDKGLIESFAFRGNNVHQDSFSVQLMNIVAVISTNKHIAGRIRGNTARGSEVDV